MFTQLWRIWRPLLLLHGSAASMEGLATLIQGICNNRFLGVRVADASPGRNGNTGVHVWREGERRQFELSSCLLETFLMVKL